MQPSISRKVNVNYRSHSGLTLILSIHRLLTPHYRFQGWTRKVPKDLESINSGRGEEGGAGEEEKKEEEEEAAALLALSLSRRRELCKFPLPPRRRFSLIADRSSCWVINVRHGQSEGNGRQWRWRENYSRGKEQSSGKIEERERKKRNPPRADGEIDL